jgi:hypothetical protein
LDINRRIRHVLCTYLYAEGKGLHVFLVAKFLQTAILVSNDVKFKQQR